MSGLRRARSARPRYHFASSWRGSEVWPLALRLAFLSSLWGASFFSPLGQPKLRQNRLTIRVELVEEVSVVLGIEIRDSGRLLPHRGREVRLGGRLGASLAELRLHWLGRPLGHNQTP